MQEPPKRLEKQSESSFKALLAHVREEKFLCPGLFVAAGFTHLVAYAMVAWAPTLLQREMGVPVSTAAYGFGLAHFIAAVGGRLAMRATLTAAALISSFGLGLGPPLVAAIAQAQQSRAHALGTGIT